MAYLIDDGLGDGYDSAGDGNGYGDGFGDGNGYGAGDGNGYGDGFGADAGFGDGDGDGGQLGDENEMIDEQEVSASWVWGIVLLDCLRQAESATCYSSRIDGLLLPRF